MSSTLDLQSAARLWWGASEVAEVWRDGVQLWQKPAASSPLVLDAIEINLDAAQCPINSGSIADLTGAHTLSAGSGTVRREVSTGGGNRWTYTLDGNQSSRILEATTIPPALTGLQQATAEAWVNPHRTGIDDGIFASQFPDNGEGPFDLRFDKAGYLGDGTNVIKFSAGSIDLETTSGVQSTGWQHLAAVYDSVSGTVRVYKNGVDLGSSATTGDFSTGITCSEFIIGQGGKNTRSDALDGDVAILRIHRRALSLSEVLQNYNAQAGEFGLS